MADLRKYEFGLKKNPAVVKRKKKKKMKYVFVYLGSKCPSVEPFLKKSAFNTGL